jgi:hypothetical protein
MSVFRNIRVIPVHGLKQARVTWEVAPRHAAGDVYVAFSATGVPGSWKVRNSSAPVAAGLGYYVDTDLVEVTAGHVVGFYRLMLSLGGVDMFSESLGIFTDLERREYGIMHRIIQNEYISMRSSNGFPVFHCIPRDFGAPSSQIDPDTGLSEGIECPGTPPENASYGLPYLGGFFPPVLTWMRIISIRKDTLQDRPDSLGSTETDVTKARLLAFPKPLRGHMIVEPTTDRRWLVGDQVTPYLWRGIYPIAYEVDLVYIDPGDARYRFIMPEVDLKAYRQIKYWV